jgi:hypothetical protein
MNFKELRELITVCYALGDIDDVDFAILSELYASKNLDLPYQSYGQFNLDELEEDECIAEFRFKKTDIPDLAAALKIPDVFYCPQGTICYGLEGLCIMLRRLAYPCRLSDLVPRFGRPMPELSMIFNEVISFVYKRHNPRIKQWNNLLLNPTQLERYATAITNKGAALTNCFGFIDGTVKAICRPGKNQRLVYNGHKRHHALKFQSVVTPNGMIANLYGPVGKCIFQVFLA